MRYEEIKDKTEKKFKRLTGVTPTVFKRMLAVVEQKSPTFGRPPKLNHADQLLMTLMYWREYRAQLHIGETYGVSEATVCRTINKIENILLDSGEFTLPGKKKLVESDALIEVILVDATEQTIERPKKTEIALQW